MQINLKQSEIELALKNFVAQQGISLYGKETTIAFTAGRKESGISAEITIEDADLPEFGELEQADKHIPTYLRAVKGDTPEVTKEPEAAVVVVADPEPEVEVIAPTASTVSLFN